MLAAIIGLSGPALTDAERALIRDADPAGFILFARNVRDKAQLRALTDSLRELTGRADLPILVDQEGGRVARLRPPQWPAFPAPRRFAELYDKAPISAIEAARANAQAIAVTLAEAGINVDCMPVLDLAHEGGHDVIGDRALGAEPMRVAALGRAMLDGLEAGGVLGVVKHVPGHGRARADPHATLPVVDATRAELALDLAPFRALADAPIAMAAHLLYTAWDKALPASASPTIIAAVIRGEIGYDGLLLSDDVGMGALAGLGGARDGPAGESPYSGAPERVRAVIAAGCDLALHCSGVAADNEAVAAALGAMSEAATARLERALARIAGKVSAQGYEELAAKRDALLAYA